MAITLDQFMQAMQEQLLQQQQQQPLQQHQQQQQERQSAPQAQPTSERPQSDACGFDNIATFFGGEEYWQTWWWKIKTAVSGMHGVFADAVRASETGEYCNGPMVLNDDEFVAVDRAKRLKASNLGMVQFVGQVHRVGSGNDCQERCGHWTELKRGADFAATGA